MPPGVEKHPHQVADPADGSSGGPAVADSLSDARTEHPHHHHILLEPPEDRWRWRRKIRENPHQLFVYRLLVAIGGLLLVCLGFVSGPLPGPGGIPLVLLGLAVWSSEFEWANRLMGRFKHGLRRYRSWSPRGKIAFWLIFFGCCAMVGYAYLLLLGVPTWAPGPLESLLQRLPGL
jgi:uncharacterized protein (TIGR02611 family)